MFCRHVGHSLTFKCRRVVVSPAGVEPAYPPSQGGDLSIELRGQIIQFLHQLPLERSLDDPSFLPLRRRNPTTASAQLAVRPAVRSDAADEAMIASFPSSLLILPLVQDNLQATKNPRDFSSRGLLKTSVSWLPTFNFPKSVHPPCRYPNNGTTADKGTN